MNYEGLDRESVVNEYIKHLEHSDRLQKMISDLKSTMSKWVDEGEEDEKGHRWLKVGRYLLQKQKRQGSPVLDQKAVEEWAKSRGIWGQVTKTVEILDEDALLAYVYDHRDEDGLEETYKSFFKDAPISYAFIKPKEEDTYDY